MSKMTIDMVDGSNVPKRGDLLQSNVDTRRSRTWFVLAARRLRPTKGVPRARLWIERWWEIEPELRLRLFRSAERNGGQQVVYFDRYKPKKKLGFEQLMRRTTLTLALLLTLAAEAQSVPATYPEHVDIDGGDPPQHKLFTLYELGNLLAKCFIQPDGALTDCVISDGVPLDKVMTMTRLSMVDMSAEGPTLTCPIVHYGPPAKHHSTAPRAHQSHARRKVRK